MERDRLKRKLKKKAVRNTLFVLLGITLFGIFLFTFGMQLLINFSLLLAQSGNEKASNTQEVSYIAAPDLNPVEDATNSAKTTISGSSTIEKATIKLYINDTLIDSTKVDSKNEFKFRNVILEKGDNEVKTKTVTGTGQESNYSSPITILYRSKAPELIIEYPSSGQTLKQNQQTLRGKTDAGASVTVNGFRAIVTSDGSFTYDIKLNDGGNTIKVITTDAASNKTEKELTVTYSP